MRAGARSMYIAAESSFASPLSRDRARGQPTQPTSITYRVEIPHLSLELPRLQLVTFINALLSPQRPHEIPHPSSSHHEPFPEPHLTSTRL
jgi:hypothetical protein